MCKFVLTLLGSGASDLVVCGVLEEPQAGLHPAQLLRHQLNLVVLKTLLYL